MSWQAEVFIGLRLPHATKGGNLGWSTQEAFYRSAAGGLGFVDEHWISLRVAQFYEDAALNPLNEAADLFVQISDGLNEAVVRLGSVGNVPYPEATDTALSMMRTVRPLGIISARWYLAFLNSYD